VALLPATITTAVEHEAVAQRLHRARRVAVEETHLGEHDPGRQERLHAVGTLDELGEVRAIAFDRLGEQRLGLIHLHRREGLVALIQIGVGALERGGGVVGGRRGQLPERPIGHPIVALVGLADALLHRRRRCFAGFTVHVHGQPGRRLRSRHTTPEPYQGQEAPPWHTHLGRPRYRADRASVNFYRKAISVGRSFQWKVFGAFRWKVFGRQIDLTSGQF
jgi:hypothetical protein